MLSLAELTRAVAILAGDLEGARVDRVVQADAHRVVLGLFAPGRGETHVLLCCDPATARLSILSARVAAPPAPPAFAQLLRARISGARIASLAILDADRQAAFRFEGEAGAATLVLSLLGPRSNVYLLDVDARVVGALRPIAETRRDLALGAPWKSPPSRPPGASEDRFAAVADDAFFAAVEALAAERAARGEQDTLARRIERALRKGQQAAEKKLALVRADAASADDVDALRRRGDLLKSVLADVKRGARSVVARDFETGAPVEIELDPALAPRKNLDALYAKARKAEKRAARAAVEIGEAEARLDAVSALARDFGAIAPDDAAALAAFAEHAEVARLLGRFAGGTAAATPRPSTEVPPRRVWRLGKTELPARLVPRVYKSSTGLEIWVGRSDEGNDLLSTRLARGHDLFFHLEASPGSHVVLRTEGRSDPPSEAMLEAAELAVHFSKHKKVTEAQVTVAAIKHVSKPRGAKPGLVYVTGGRSLRLRRDPKRLDRVLASREGGE